MNENTKIIVQSYNQKILDNIENEILLNNIFQKEKGKLVLINSSCGSGKTYTIDKIFENIKKEHESLPNKISTEIKSNLDNIFNYSNESEMNGLIDYFIENTNFLNILLCPTRVQNQQNDQKYEMKCIISGSNEYVKKNNSFSVVYEKFEEILKILELKNQIKVNIVIDEAHELLNSRTFRDSIKNITKSFDDMLRKNCNIILMSGTTDGIKCLFDFDYFIQFKKEIEESIAENLIICEFDEDNYTGSSKKVFADYYFNYLLNGTTNNICHINSKNKIQQLEAALVSMDKKVHTLTSDDKEFFIDEKNQIHFNNKTLENLIYKEEVFEGYTLATSVFENGTNNNFADDMTMSFIMVNGAKDCNIESIIQFANRTRKKYKNLVIIKRKPKYKIDFKSRDEIRKIEEEKVNQNIYLANSFIRSLQIIKKYDDDKALCIYMKNFMDTVIDDGLYNEKMSMNCIYLDEENLKFEVDYLSFEKRIYEKYQSQFYFFPELLSDEIQKYLKVDNIKFVSNIENMQKITTSELECADKIKEKAIETLDNLEPNEMDILKEIIINRYEINSIKNDNIKTKIRDILKYKPYKNSIKELLFYGIDIESIIQDLLHYSKDYDLRNFNKKYKYSKAIWINTLYIEDKICNFPERKLILDTFYKMNKNNNLIKTTITNEIIKNLKDEINNFSIKRYNEKDVINLIKEHFILGENKKLYRIERLRKGV